MTIKDTKANCRVCGGKIVVQIRQVYYGDLMNMIIGPGHRNQLSQESTMFCEDCGITYNHLPKVPTTRDIMEIGNER